MRHLRKRTSQVVAGIAIVTAATLGLSHAAFASTVIVQEHDSTGFCMNDPQDSSVNGTAIELWACTNDQSETANSVQEGSNPNLYELTLGPGKCLTDPFGGGSGTAVEIWNCNQNSNQLWKWVNNGYTDTWVNDTTGLAIDLYQDSNTNGTPIIVYTLQTGHAAEEWDWATYN